MLRRYVVLEVLYPFAAWTGFLCVLFFVMAFLRGTEVLLGSAVTLADFARFSGYLVPGFVVQALPISFLLAILLGLGHLADDGELKAMQALGVSPAQLVGGPLVLGLAVSAVLAALMAEAQPWGQRMVRYEVQDIIRRNLLSDVKPGVFHEEVLGLTLYAAEVGPEARWRGVLLHDGRDPERPLLLVAAEGRPARTEWVDAVRFDLERGSVHRATRGSSDYAVLEFDTASLRVGIAEAFLQKNQLGSARADLSPRELYDAAARADAEGGDGRPFLVTLHWRLGQMLMPLAFALLGVPLAMVRRGGRGWGFLFTIAGYVGFSMLARVAVQLADAQLLAPALAGQLPNLVFGGIGSFLLRRVVRRGAA
jgi:lipopolysaccharide export system permease protein